MPLLYQVSVDITLDLVGDMRCDCGGGAVVGYHAPLKGSPWAPGERELYPVCRSLMAIRLDQINNNPPK